jgi:signal peptidase
MEPSINMGDILFSRGVDPATIKISDIIVFDAYGLWADAPEEPIAHRVIEKWEANGSWYFQTKGDASTLNDRAPIPENRIIGVIYGRIPYIGLIYVFINKAGFFFFPIVALIAVLIWLNWFKKKKAFSWKSYR